MATQSLTAALSRTRQVTALRIRERLPNTVIFGHIPPLETLRNGTPEDVRRVALTYMKNLQFVVLGNPQKIDKGIFTRTR